MSAKEKIVHGRGPSNIDLEIVWRWRGLVSGRWICNPPSCHYMDLCLVIPDSTPPRFVNSQVHGPDQFTVTNLGTKPKCYQLILMHKLFSNLYDNLSE